MSACEKDNSSGFEGQKGVERDFTVRKVSDVTIRGVNDFSKLIGAYIFSNTDVYNLLPRHYESYNWAECEDYGV